MSVLRQRHPSLELNPNRKRWEEKPHLAPVSPEPSFRFARPPRILVLTVSVGSGHLRAAEAIELALRQLAPDAEVCTADVLRLSTAPFRHCYGQMYLDFINVAPQVLGFFYNLMDRLRAPGRTPWDRLRVSLETMSMRPFLRLLKATPWDLVINTHFLSAEVIAGLRIHGRFQAPQLLVTTDFETHRLWVTQPCEHYFTATEEAARYLTCFGVPPEDVSTTGIPVHPVFCEAKERTACLLRHGLRGDRPIVLQLAGGHGVGPMEALYRSLLAVEQPMELVVVSGRNARAKKQLDAIVPPVRHRVRVLGFTKQIDELMTVADLVVSKPGGLTTSETLARGAAMVIVNPVPGQEERNSDYLLEHGAAIKVNHLATLPLKLNALLADPDALAQLKVNARRLGRPRAAFDVAGHALAMLERSIGPG